MKSQFQKANEAKVKALGLKWSRKSDGGVVAHSAMVGNCLVEVENYPGSKTLMWRVSKPGNESCWHTEDRFEYSVATLKLKAVEAAQRLINQLAD